MKLTALMVVLILASCAQAESSVQPPAQMSDEALCFALAEAQAQAGVLAEMQKRNLNCGDLVKPDENLAPGHQNWRKIVEEASRR